MRSPLVAGWQGLEMRAWQSWSEAENRGQPLAPLRIDRLAPEIMLCIFNGPVVRIEIQQPPEGMHFGAAPAAASVPDGPNYVKTTLRRLVPAERAGEQVVGEKELVLPMRREPKLYKGTKRVVEIAELARQLETSLRGDTFDMSSDGKRSPHANVDPVIDRSSEFTSAELGVQMTESPGRVFIDIPVRAKAHGLFPGYAIRSGQA
jgi:hypothetical protein